MARTTLTDRLTLDVLPPLVAAYVRLVRRTTRWTRIGEAHWRGAIDAPTPFLLVMWHSRLLMVPVLSREFDRSVHAIVSEHRDGEVIARVLERLGVQAARGSAADPRKPHKAKGGAGALKKLIGVTRAGGNAAITPDGPRGPRQRAQPGIAQLAKLTGLPVVPIAYAVRPARFLPSWDRFVVPLPFGRGVFVFGEPVTVTGRGPDALEAGRVRIEEALNRVTAEADAWAGHEVVPPAPKPVAVPASQPEPCA